MSTTITAGNATNNGASIASDTAGTIEIKTGSTPTTAITVDTSQNVGIGTASPATKLNLGGTSDQSIQINGSGTAAYVGTSTAVAQISSNRNPATGAIYDSGRAVSYINLEASSGNGNIQFYTTATNNVNATERMRIDSSGNVGIGTSTPGYTAANRVSVQANGASSAIFSLAYGGTNAGYFYADSANTIIWSEGSRNLLLGTASAGPIQFTTNNTERMRITSTGIACIGTTGSLDGQLSIYNPLATYCLTLQDRGTTGGIRFNNSSGTQVGGVYIGSSSVTYATTSDYRLKENIAPMTGALAKVQQLKPVTYTWKTDGADGQGFIAHELQEVCPDAVAGEKDAVNEDGSIKPQSIDTSFLVATLTAAIQELNAKVDAQAAEIAALKGAK